MRPQSEWNANQGEFSPKFFEQPMKETRGQVVNERLEHDGPQQQMRNKAPEKKKQNQGG
jgi:hypothetical protein